MRVTQTQRACRQAAIACFALWTTSLALPAQAREISAQDAIAQAQRETAGKVLSVQTLNVSKRKIYRIKLLTRDGQVRIVQIPAQQ